MDVAHYTMHRHETSLLHTTYTACQPHPKTTTLSTVTTTTTRPTRHASHIPKLQPCQLLQQPLHDLPGMPATFQNYNNAKCYSNHHTTYMACQTHPKTTTTSTVTTTTTRPTRHASRILKLHQHRLSQQPLHDQHGMPATTLNYTYIYEHTHDHPCR
jgi:hypothetical protein